MKKITQRKTSLHLHRVSKIKTLAHIIAVLSSSAVAAADLRIEEVVVTAEKRAETVNKVPMTISAATGEDLAKLGITDTAGLTKLVPGLQYTQSMANTAVYTLRGIGFYDLNFSAGSTVAIYVDETPLPLTVETDYAALDVERVEVLKGPQGTLFGQNATGGAINFISAKPTHEFEAGVGVKYNNFSQVDTTGFVSGPLSDTVRARLALSSTQGGAWQKSVSRGEKLGDKDKLAGRLLLDYTPTDDLNFQLNINGWSDHSETTAARYQGLVPNQPVFFTPAGAAFFPSQSAYLAQQPITGSNRNADWTPGANLKRDAHQQQTALRIEYAINDELQLVSLTNHVHFKDTRGSDPDGTPLDNVRFIWSGDVKSFTQEFRLVGDTDALQYIFGVSYDKSKINENDLSLFPDSTITPLFTFVGAAMGLPPSAWPGPFVNSPFFSKQTYENKGVFTNLKYALTDTVNVNGGVRFTQSKATASGCTLDDPTTSALTSGLGDLVFNYLAGNPFFSGNASRVGLGFPAINYPAGGCITSNDSDPTNANTYLVPGVLNSTLRENNVSWRVGIDYAPTYESLLYANISKGFKAGQFPTLQANLWSQLAPAKQESLIAYEAGFKLGLLDQSMQLNGAVFYYDYSDKQFRGRIFDPIMGSAETMINVPKSEITGVELQLVWLPIEGVTLTLGGTHLDTKVTKSPQFTVFDPAGTTIDINGSQFPYTPDTQATADVEYRVPVSDSLEVFAGISGYYQSGTVATFEGKNYGVDPLFKLDSYTLLDLRAGVNSTDGKWRLSAFGRNVTNKTYATNATKMLDAAVQFSGQPATYGVDVAFRY